jgi:hypothetical protein
MASADHELDTAAVIGAAVYPYVWFWKQQPHWDRGTSPRVFDRERKGERCRMLARGRMNSGLIEFEDGYRVVTSRNGLRRAAPA